jgi:excinuclease UvrABC helicase subunit UvrB
MIETDKKTQRQAEFMRQHTISPAEFKRMIAEKMERAKAYSKAVKKREVLSENR